MHRVRPLRVMTSDVGNPLADSELILQQGGKQMQHNALYDDTINSLNARLPDLRRQWHRSKPFRWVVIDNFLPEDHAERVHDEYPTPYETDFDETTYAHQKGKFTKTEGFEGAMKQFFDFGASPEFLRWLEALTGIDDLLADPTLEGGGLHQIGQGGYLDIHIDYNRHPQFKWHRRLNLLVYMNKDWKREYNGQLELWDFTDGNEELLEELYPSFNTALIFETNEISYHGHPHPVDCPAPMTRKSMALYFYTEERDDEFADAPEHNTIYRQTTGVSGYLKTSRSAVEAMKERVEQMGVRQAMTHAVGRVYRKLVGKPPANR